MAALTTAKAAILMLESAIEAYESQQSLLGRVNFWVPDKKDMQNGANYIWRRRQQFAPIISGWDMTGLATGVIEEEYPAVLGTPSNDFVELRIDDVRDEQFWKRRGQVSGLRQASNVNNALASAMAIQGSLFYRNNSTDALSFIGEAQAMMNERQLLKNDRTFLFNDRDNLTYAAALGGKQTLQGRPNDAWATGQIASNICDFDVFVGSYLPALPGGADPATTVTANQSFAPQAGSVSATGVVTNVDYRTATIPVTASASYNVGDKVKFASVLAVGLDDKTVTTSPFTASIVAKPSGTSVTIYPKPIAINDGALSTLEKAYGNINTTIANTNAMNRLNTDASARTNLFWQKDAVEVMGGEIPANLFAELGGKKVLSSKMKNGQTMYLMWDGDITTANVRWRLFTWNGITVANPMAVGVAVKY